MLTDLTADQIASYREHGFIVLPEFLDADELDHWRTTVDRAVEARGSVRTPFIDEPEADAYYNQTFKQRVNLWLTDDGVRGLMLDERLGRLAADLAGVDGMRMWHDQALYKPPYGNPTSFHLDVPYWSFHSPDAISLWVALDDATLENGCLYYVPGSHKAGRFDNVGIGPELGAVFDVYPEFRDVPAVPCPVKAGGALLHNGLTIHGAGANLTPFVRRAMTCGYMPDGSTFNGIPNVLHPDQLKTLRIGDVIADESRQPLLFSRKA